MPYIIIDFCMYYFVAGLLSESGAIFPLDHYTCTTAGGQEDWRLYLTSDSGVPFLV